MSKKRVIVLLCMLLCLSLAATVVLAACAKTHTVTYQSGNSAATGDVPQPQSYKTGDEVTVAQNTLVLDGYTFNGWSDGTKTYKEGEKFTMPDADVTLTAQWTKNGGSTTPSDQGDDGPDTPSGPSDDEDKPTLTELDSKFYAPANWEYMTNNNGASLDGGDKVYALSDGSVKFHRENQAIDLGKKLTKASFMLKATNDFSLWFNSSSKDNASNNSYRLVYEYSELRLVVSSAADKAAAVITSTYKKGEWNRIDIELSESEVNGDTVCAIKLYVNNERAKLAAGANTSQITVQNDVMTHTQRGTFSTGTYLVAKCWEADNYFQIKPVAKADEKDVPIVAAIGASITEGAGAGNFYTESYPAQLQNALGGGYNVINFGKSGRTVRTDTGTETDGTPVPWLENRQWDGVQAIKPDIAIINMGTNDSKTSLEPVSTLESFKAAYDHLLDELLKVNEDMRIIICTVPTAYSGIYDINNDNIRDIIAPAQRTIAEERDMELVDLYKITQNKAMLFGDGVHPGTEGYGMFAEIFKEVIENDAEQALTDDFLADIDERYNDPCAISDVHAEIAVEDGQINLTVTGHIEILVASRFDESKLRLHLYTDDATQETRDVPFTLDPDGNFSVTARLDDLSGINWYIITLYLTDGYNYIVMLNESEYTVGTSFDNQKRKVTVQSWSNRLNLKIEDIIVSATEITFSEQYLVVKGTVIDSVTKLTLALHNDNDKTNDIRVDATIADGKFEVKLDLTKITLGPNSWLYLWFSVDDGDDTKVQYPKNDTKHVYGDREYRFENFEGIAIAYSNYTPPVPDDVTIEITELTFDGADLKVKGTVSGAEALKFDLYASEDSESYEADAQISEGTFEVSIPLPPLGTAHNGSWYRLRVAADDEGYSNLTWPEHGAAVSAAKSTTHTNGYYQYSFVSSSDDIALITSNYTPLVPEDVTIAITEITFDGADLKVKGTVSGAETLKFDLYASEDSEKYEANAQITAGTFEVSIPLPPSGTAHNGSWYFLRVAVDDGLYSRLNWTKHGAAASEAKSTTHTHEAYKYSFVSSSDDIALVTGDAPVQKDYTVTASSITFEEQYLVVKGTVTGNVTKLTLALHNDNDKTNDIRVDATIADGKFEVKLDLTKITLGPNSWLYLWFSVDDGDDTKVQYPKNDTKHVYGDREYRFENFEGIAIAYSNYTPPVEASLSVTSMRFENGKFIVEGTCNEAAEKITFHLNNTTGKKMDVAKDATITEGSFKVEFDLDSIKDMENGDSIKTYINVRYAFNDEQLSAYRNLLPTTNGEFTVGQEYRYGERTWTLNADSNRTYLNWSANEEKYILTSVKLEIVEQAPTLTIEGYLTGDNAQLEVGQIHLKLDKTMGTTKVKWVSNTATEAGHFKFSVDLSELVASVNTQKASEQQAYFIRLFTGASTDAATKLADINSRWASDLLWEKGQIETDSATYFLMKNTDLTGTTWNTLGICKFDKQA